MRDSRFEIIRIISMMFIIMYHYTLYGNWSNETINSFKIQFFSPWGQIGVGLFVMITSYFMSGKDLDLKSSFLRNKRIWIKTVYYSWIILVLTIVFNSHNLKWSLAIFAVFPIIFNEYWFISSYIVLIFLLPFLNMMVRKCNKRELQIYIGIIVIVTDIMPYIQNTNPNAPLGGMLSVGGMLAPYLAAAYIKKYNFKLNTFRALMMIIVGLTIEYISVFIMSKYSNNPGRFTGGLLSLIIIVGIFLFFLNLKPINSKMINWLASGVLASYLITEHPLFRLTFWHQILNVSKFQNPTWLFILMGIVVSFLTVIFCSIIDHLYQRVYKNFK